MMILMYARDLKVAKSVSAVEKSALKIMLQGYENSGGTPERSEGSARQIYGSILLQTALNMSTQSHWKFIRKLIL
jgi:hypothetical protein